MAPQEVTVRLLCHLFWVMLAEYDNSGNTNSVLTRTIDVTKSRIINGREYRRFLHERSLEESTESSEATMRWSPISVSVSLSRNLPRTVKDFVSSTTEISYEETVREETKVTESFSIGPGDKLFVYQQSFSCVGLHFDFGPIAVVSTKKTSEDDEDVYINVQTKPVEFIKDIEVVYGGRPSDAPHDRVREYTGWNDDINFQMKGDYVWLVPRYTLNADEACTSFDFQSQRTATHMKDLASGAGGTFRYIVPIRDAREPRKITKLVLMRQDHYDNPHLLRAKLGKEWSGSTFDINAGRGGTWLYLAWELH